MKMYLISDNVDTYTGMRLAGVEGCVVHERGELREALERAIADKENGIILLTEKFGREFPDIVDDVKLNRRLPLIVEIPDRHGTGRKADLLYRDSSWEGKRDSHGSVFTGAGSVFHACCLCRSRLAF